MKRLMIHGAAIATALLLTLNVPPAAFAQGKGAGEQGSANGQPFKRLQLQIDLLRADLDAAVADLQLQIDDLVASQADQDVVIAAIQTAVSLLQDRVATNEGDIAALQAVNDFQDQLITALQTDLSNLEARVAANENDIAAIILADQAMQLLIDAIEAQIANIHLLIAANAGDIASLQGQVASLGTLLASVQAELVLKQNRVAGVCPVGSSIRQINPNGSVVCEADDVSAGVGTLQTATATASQEIPSAGLTVGVLSLSAVCPSTYRVTGGGYEITSLSTFGDERLVQVQRSRAFGNTAWNTRVFNDNLVVFGCCRVNLAVQARCAKVE